MDLSQLIRRRLDRLGFDQKNLAGAAGVTESYISQLLAGKKVPPSPGRTEIYERISRFLKLPAGELSRLAEIQRRRELQKRIGETAAPLFRERRELILEKCEPGRRREVRQIFEKDAFGELERLITQKILEVVRNLAREHLGNEAWLRLVARRIGGSVKHVRESALALVETDIFQASFESRVLLLDPVIDSWDIDLRTFAITIVLNTGMAAESKKRFEFVETAPEAGEAAEPGFEEFLKSEALSAGVTGEEIEFLRGLKFGSRRPTALYYYRELQSLRDPLHFRTRGRPGADGSGGRAGTRTPDPLGVNEVL